MTRSSHSGDPSYSKLTLHLAAPPLNKPKKNVKEDPIRPIPIFGHLPKLEGFRLLAKSYSRNLLEFEHLPQLSPLESVCLKGKGIERQQLKRKEKVAGHKESAPPIFTDFGFLQYFGRSRDKGKK